MSESCTCISHLFLCNDEVIGCYAEGLIDLCSTRDRRDVFPLTGYGPSQSFHSVQSRENKKLKLGPLILKMDRVEG